MKLNWEFERRWFAYVESRTRILPFQRLQSVVGETQFPYLLRMLPICVCTKPYLGGYSGIPNPISHENLYLEHGNFSLFRRTLLHLPNTLEWRPVFAIYTSSAGYWTNPTKDLLSKQNFCYRFINHPGAFPCFSLCACCYKMKDLCVDF